MINMTTMEFGEMCRPYNKKYKSIFGYVPCKGHFKCNQTEYFEALLKSIETKQDISKFLTKYEYDYSNPNIKY